MITLSNTPTLETERLILRAPGPQDADAYIRFYTSDRAQYVGGPKTKREAWNAFSTVLGHWVLRDFGMFAVTRKGDDSILGIVGHWYPNTWPEKEVGWVLLDGAHEGQGIAAEAARAALDHAWTTLKWDAIVSYIDPENAASIALAERLGAQRDHDAAIPSADYPCLVYRHVRGQA